VGISFMLVWLWTGLVDAASRWYGEGNIIPNEENPNFYRFKKSLELYVYLLCFFSNILIVITPSLDKFWDLSNTDRASSWSAFLGLSISTGFLLIDCLEGATRFLKLKTNRPVIPAL
jgi:hypothetical protein